MDPELLLIIFGFVILVTMVVGISVNGIVQKVLDFKRETRALETSNGSDRADSQIAERTSIIEDRLAVLERIATDRGQLLSDEIEALRGPAALEGAIEDKRSEVN